MGGDDLTYKCRIPFMTNAAIRDVSCENAGNAKQQIFILGGAAFRRYTGLSPAPVLNLLSPSPAQ